jgi:N-acetylmuramoyl-L-alanine amidase CwlA
MCFVSQLYKDFLTEQHITSSNKEFLNKLQTLKLLFLIRYKYGGAMVPAFVTIHNTANSASANNEATYLNNRQDNVYISFHYAVDDIQALQLLPNNEAGWHAGDGYGDGNRKSVAIEICYSTSTNLTLKNKSLDNGAQLAAKLLKTLGLSIDKLRKHQDWSGKFCPHDILERYGWESFKSLVLQYYLQ